MERIGSGETGEEIDEMRGLYICLNAFQVNELHYRMRKIELIEESRFGEFQLLRQRVEEQSAGSGSAIQLSQQFNGVGCFEKRESCAEKLLSQIKDSDECPLLCIGSYCSYFRAVTAYDISINRLLSAFNEILAQRMSDLHDLQSELRIMERYQCCTLSHRYMNCIPGIENKVYLSRKIEMLSNMRKNYFGKEFVEMLLEMVEVCTNGVPKFRRMDAKPNYNSMVRTAYDF
jgi:hypothetical protein